MEYLANQKLEHTPEEDNPMSDDFPELSIVIPADWPNYQSIPVPDHVPVPQLLDFDIPVNWPSQQSIPEPDHMQEPQPISHDAYPAVPSHRPPLEVTIPEDPPSPASLLGKCSALPTSVVLQPQYARIWNAEGLIHKHSPITTVRIPLQCRIADLLLKAPRHLPRLPLMRPHLFLNPPSMLLSQTPPQLLLLDIYPLDLLDAYASSSLTRTDL